MIRFFYIWAIAFLGLISCKNAQKMPQTSASTEITNEIYFQKKAIISAHRAGKGIANYPENCLETMQFLLKKGIFSFEIDIFETSDGVPMLLHDNRLGRTATGEGVASEMSSEALRKSKLIDDFNNVTEFQIPYLKEVLEWSKKNNAWLMLDFKKGISYQKTIDLVRSEKMENQVVLISYSVQQAEKLHELAPEMLLSVAARNHQELDRILQTNIPPQKMVAFTGTRLSEESLYQRLASLKIPAILGTLGNLDKQAEARKNENLYKKWEAMGIQVFSTDRPLDIEL